MTGCHAVSHSHGPLAALLVKISSGRVLRFTNRPNVRFCSILISAMLILLEEKHDEGELGS